ncbi:MAG: metallophosphoesterase [Bacteroides sp.]|nr:metallophosphoesterase [Bacteroides sp.]
MKKILLSLLMSSSFLGASAQSLFKVNHGPYLQEVTRDGATIVFTTSQKAFSWIELKEHGAVETEAVKHFSSKDGLKEAWNTFNAVRVEDLKPGTSYDYRVVSKEMRSFEPYKVVFGDSLATEWHTFSTVNPKKQGGTFFITSDMHFDAVKLEKLLHAAAYQTCDAFFYVGDMTSYIAEPEAPFTSFIDTSVKLFASSIPFEVVRGNHETRGNLARTYSSYFPKRDGKIYGSYLLGDVMIVMLDSGEDKAENHWVYAGLTDYDAYRTEQAEWLKKLVKTEAYKKAKYRIVLSHFPMVMGQEWKDEHAWYGWEDAIRKFLPVLNKAKVDLMVSGHTHRFFFHERNADGNAFPVLEQGADSAVRLELHDGKIWSKVVDVDGKVLLEMNIS